MTSKVTSVTSFCDVIICMTHLIAVLMTSPSTELNLSPVYWNFSNPMFKASRNDHVIQVSLYDEMDFICPYYESQFIDPSYHEYYTIYQVSRAEYKGCVLYQENARLMILSCSNPQRRKRFTLLFDPFPSIPNAPEYRAGNTYYYITTSTGKVEGLSNTDHGACLYFNMKLTIHVCCSSPNIDSIKDVNMIANIDRVSTSERRTTKNQAPSSSSSSSSLSSSSLSSVKLSSDSSLRSGFHVANTQTKHSGDDQLLNYDDDDYNNDDRSFQIVLPSVRQRDEPSSRGCRPLFLDLGGSTGLTKSYCAISVVVYSIARH